MELTPEQRAELEAIQLGSDARGFPQSDGERRPAARAAYKAKVRTLEAFNKAWRALDEDTQWDIACGIRAMWEEEGGQPPDATRVIESLLQRMSKSNGAPEEHPGLKDATLILWQATSDDWGSQKRYDKPRQAEIAAKLAVIFDMPPAEAERRARNAVDTLRKEGRITG